MFFSNSEKFSDVASGFVESERHPSGNNIVGQIFECLWAVPWANHLQCQQYVCILCETPECQDFEASWMLEILTLLVKCWSSYVCSRSVIYLAATLCCFPLAKPPLMRCSLLAKEHSAWLTFLKYSWKRPRNFADTVFRRTKCSGAHIELYVAAVVEKKHPRDVFFSGLDDKFYVHLHFSFTRT